MNVNTQAPSPQTIDRGTQTESSTDSNFGKFLSMTVKKSCYENFMWDAREWKNCSRHAIENEPGNKMRIIGVSAGIACGIAIGKQMLLGPLGVMCAGAAGFLIGGQASYVAREAFIRECQRLYDLEKAVTIQPQESINPRSRITRDEDRTNPPPSYNEVMSQIR